MLYIYDKGQRSIMTTKATVQEGSNWFNKIQNTMVHNGSKETKDMSKNKPTIDIFLSNKPSDVIGKQHPVIVIDDTIHLLYAYNDTSIKDTKKVSDYGGIERLRATLTPCDPLKLKTFYGYIVTVTGTIRKVGKNWINPNRDNPNKVYKLNDNIWGGNPTVTEEKIEVKTPQSNTQQTEASKTPQTEAMIAYLENHISTLEAQLKEAKAMLLELTLAEPSRPIVTQTEPTRPTVTHSEPQKTTVTKKEPQKAVKMPDAPKKAEVTDNEPVTYTYNKLGQPIGIDLSNTELTDGLSDMDNKTLKKHITYFSNKGETRFNYGLISIDGVRVELLKDSGTWQFRLLGTDYIVNWHNPICKNGKVWRNVVQVVHYAKLAVIAIKQANL